MNCRHAWNSAVLRDVLLYGDSGLTVQLMAIIATPRTNQ